MSDEELEQLALDVTSRLTGYSAEEIRAAFANKELDLASDYACVLDALLRARGKQARPSDEVSNAD